MKLPSLPGDIPARGQVPGRNLVQVSCHRWHRQAKRLGEDWFFSGAFGVFTAFVLFLCLICLEVMSFFVYLQTKIVILSTTNVHNNSVFGIC